MIHTLLCAARRRGDLTAVTLILASLALVPCAAAQTAEEKSHAERLEFDPQTGRWNPIAAPLPGTEAGDLELARASLAREEFDAARSALKTWRDSHPDSERQAEGLFYSADVEVSAVQAGHSGDLMKAYEWYERILDNHAGTPWADRALRRELIIAEMFLFKGVKQWVWGGVLRVSATEEALDILNRLIDQRAPGTALAEQALRLKADYHYNAGEFLEAEIDYARLARDYPRGRYERLALLRSADAAFAGFAGVDFDDKPLLEADERYRRYADQYPDSAAAEGVGQRLERIRENRAEKEFRTGRFYERTHQTRAAAYYYRFVVDKWPDTTAARDARARLELLDPGSVPQEPSSMPAASQDAELFPPASAQRESAPGEAGAVVPPPDSAAPAESREPPPTSPEKPVPLPSGNR